MNYYGWFLDDKDYSYLLYVTQLQLMKQYVMTFNFLLYFKYFYSLIHTYQLNLKRM